MRTAMSEYLLALQTKVTLLKATALPIILLLSLALLTGNFIAPLDVIWGICGLAFGGMSLNTIRRYRATTLTIQHDLGSFEVVRLLTEQGLLDYTFQHIEPEAFTPSITRALKNAPGYCTPLEMLNKMSEIDELDNRDIQTAVAIVKGSGDDCTFATSPFTSPPMCTMEIFVRREETVVYEVIDAYIPSGTPSPLVLDCDLPDVATPALTELIKYCEAAIMESNMRDMELF